MDGRWFLFRKIAAGTCLLVGIIWTLSAPGYAAGKKPAKKKPETPKVIGSVVSHERLPFNTTPAALKVFPREAYRDQGQAALSTVLTQTPGVSVLRSSASNAAQPLGPYSAVVRGGFPWETATLIDGNSVVLPSSSTFNLSYVPSFVLQEVEIVKGFGSAETTMPGVINGAVNLRTADPGTARKGMLETEIDSRGGQFSDFMYGGTEPGGRFSFTTMFSADGNRGPAPQIDAAGSAFQRSQLLKAHYAISPAVSGTFTYLGSQGNLGVAVARGFESPFGFGTLADSDQARETHVFGLYSAELGADAGGDHLTAKAYVLRLQRTGTYEPYVFPYIGSSIDALDDVRGVSLQDDRRIGGNIYEVQVSQRTGTASAFFCPAASSCAALIPSGAHAGDAMLRGSAIFNTNAKTQVELSAAQLWLWQRSGLQRVPVAHTGVSYKIKPNVTVRFAAGSGAAAEPLAYQYQPQSGLGNNGIETGFGYDAGAEYRLHGDTTTLSADVFATETHGAWYAADPIAREGAEISLQQFKRVGLGFIVQGALLRQTPQQLQFRPVLLTPYAQGYAELSYKWPRGSRASIGALYEGANNPFGRPAFAQLNANLELSLNDFSKLQFSVENLSNAYGGSLPLYRYPIEANVLPARTFRFMFRTSIGGSLYEH